MVRLKKEFLFVTNVTSWVQSRSYIKEKDLLVIQGITRQRPTSSSGDETLKTTVRHVDQVLYHISVRHGVSKRPFDAIVMLDPKVVHSTGKFDGNPGQSCV